MSKRTIRAWVGWIACATVLGLGGATRAAGTRDPAPASAQTVARGGVATVSGAGRQDAVFTVDAFGRYAITARSPHGAAIQVVDAMAGPGPIVGVAGELDGRADVFLDKGRVKVVSLSPAAATGKVELRVTPFAQPSEPPPRLVERRLVRGTLADLTTRAYWVDLSDEDEARVVMLEASGRYLDDLRLWRDGSWLVDAAPRCRSYSPVEGQPWRSCGLVTQLEPGLYLVTAYGGAGAPWSEASDAAPFELRWGFPALGTAGRIETRLGPSGVQRWLVPKGPDLFDVQLPDVANVELRVARVDPASRAAEPYSASLGQASRVTTESRRPTATVSVPGADVRVVTVTGPPGQPISLSWFEQRRSLTLREPGTWLVATVAAGDPVDSVDPTAVVYRRTKDGKAIRSVAQAVTVDQSQRFERTFNLSAATTILLDVTAAGPYAAWTEGVKASLRIVPYLTERPAGYQEPRLAPAEVAATLDPGLYKLEVSPSEKGIVTLRVGPDSWASRAKRAVGLAASPTQLRPAIQLRQVEIEAGGALEVEVFGQPDVPIGIVARKLPLDPADPVPLALLPTEWIDLPVRVGERGQLTVARRGGALPFTVDGGVEARAAQVEPGEHTVRVRNDQANVVLAALGFEPDSAAPDRPLPRLDPARAPNPSAFSRLTPDAPSSTELGAGREQTFRLEVDAPGLYVVESTGLLATRGTVRTRTVTHLADGDRNGIGRNFAVGRYLGAGDYQVTVGTLGESAGHLGVRARRTAIHDGGELTLDAGPGAPAAEARATVPADDAIAYRFTLAEPGVVHVSHRGRTGVFSCRVEDGDGWPVAAPDVACDVDLALTAGDYRVIGLPSSVETRRITAVERRQGAAEPRSGHGPFPLAVGVGADHVWREPTDPAAERQPDVWTLDVPARVDASVSLSSEMVGEVRVGDELVARVVPGTPWSGVLPPGPARIEVRGARKGTGVPYRIEVDTAQLVAGGSRAVTAPARVPVAIGAPGVYTLASAGSADVRARLVDAGGRSVAANDDRPDDWNFQLSARLDPGAYTLVIDAVDGGAAGAPVAPRARFDEPEPEPSDTGGGGEGDGDYGEGEGDYGDDGDDGDYGDYGDGGDDYGGDGGGGGTTVSLRAPDDVPGPALSTQRPVEVSPGDDAVLLAIADRADVVAVEATSSENVGVAIERAEADGWRALSWGTSRPGDNGLVADAIVRVDPTSDGAPVRLRARVWSEDARGGRVSVRLFTLRTGPSGGDEVKRGFGKELDAARTGAFGVFRVTRQAPGGAVWACGTEPGCAPIEDGVVAAGDGGLVLVGRGADVRAERVRLADDADPATLRVGPSPLDVDLASRNAASVVIARAASGRPGVALSGTAGMATSGAAAAAVTLGGSATAKVWSASGGDADVRVAVRTVKAAARASAGLGRTAITVPARGYVAVGLGGKRDATVALGADLLLASDDGRVGWADGDGRTFVLHGVDSKLWLVNPTDAEGLALIDAAPETEAGLAYDVPHEVVHTELATWLIPVASDAGRLVVDGGATGAYLRADGAVAELARGAAVDVGAGGVLALDARRGPVAAWVERSHGAGPARDVRASGAEKVKGPDLVKLKGAAVPLQLGVERGTVARIRVPVPVVATTTSVGGGSRARIVDAGGHLDLWLPEGEGTVLLRAFGADAELSGRATVSVLPVVPISDGLGPEVLLGPDDAAYFSFSLGREAAIGIGARADAERVDAVLLDGAGQELTRGLVAMKALTPGSYLLALSQAGGTRPVRVQPALVGLEAPPTGPPDEVVRRYVELGSTREDR